MEQENDHESNPEIQREANEMEIQVRDESSQERLEKVRADSFDSPQGK